MAVNEGTCSRLPAVELESVDSLSDSTSGDIIQTIIDRPIRLWFYPTFWARSALVVLSIILLALSTSFCIAQWLRTELVVYTECESKSSKQIWEDAYQRSLSDDGESVITVESQYGHHADDDCWGSDPLVIKESKLWESNEYGHQWTLSVDGKWILFGLISLSLFCLTTYAIIMLIADIRAASMGILHEKSVSYREYVRSQQLSIGTALASIPHKMSVRNQWSRLMAYCTVTYSQYLKHDTTGWIILKFLGEIFEFTIQSISILIYNGYDPFHPDDTPLAEKPHSIIAFAAVLSLNCLGSGSLWICYVLFPVHCKGIEFSRCLFYVDRCSDLLYALFPFYVILSDDSNTNTGCFELLGQLNLDSTPSFLSAFIPLLILSVKCIVLTISSMNTMRDQYFEQWIQSQSPFSVSTASSHSASRGGISGSAVQSYSVLFVAVALIGYGVTIIVLVLDHLETAEFHCGSFSESMLWRNGSLNITDAEFDALQQNPELFVWDHCRYTVYPFTNDPLYRCQCRMFDLNFNPDAALRTTAEQRLERFNLTQPKIVEGLMSHWKMLQKLRLDGNEGMRSEVKMSFTEEMVTGKHMKAFRWTVLEIESFPNGTTWNQLEFLYIRDTLAMDHNFWNQLRQLHSLRYLALYQSGVTEMPTTICSLTHLEILLVQAELQVDSVPDCLDQLRSLKVLILDAMPFVTSVPLSALTLPHLKTFSAFRNDLSWHSLLDHNLPADIDRNDTESVGEWLNENFIFRDDADYYLSLNPICFENVSFLSPRISEFMNKACDYPIGLDHPKIRETICWYVLCTLQCTPIALLRSL